MGCVFRSSINQSFVERIVEPNGLCRKKQQQHISPIHFNKSCAKDSFWEKRKVKKQKSAKMLVRRCMVSFTLGTFFKHLPTSHTKTFYTYRISPKALTTTRIINSSFLEALSPRQKDQVHLYVDTLLEWNQVFLSLSFCWSYYTWLSVCLVSGKFQGRFKKFETIIGEKIYQMGFNN